MNSGNASRSVSFRHYGFSRTEDEASLLYGGLQASDPHWYGHFILLRQLLSEQGLSIEPFDVVLGQPEVAIFIDLPTHRERLDRDISRISPDIPKILIIQETPGFRRLHDRRNFHYFNHILTYSINMQAQEVDYLPIPYDPPRDLELPNLPFCERQLLAIFTSNWSASTDYLRGAICTWRYFCSNQRWPNRIFSMSPIDHLRAQFMRSHRYRRKFAKALDHRSFVDLYGTGWQSEGIAWYNKLLPTRKYSCARGSYPGSKVLRLTNYKFGAAFENYLHPGYITEKIFDCFMAGCVPIYLGHESISEYVPASSYILINKNLDEPSTVLNYLSAMPECKWQSMIDAGREFLSSQSSFHFSAARWAHKVSALIVELSSSKLPTKGDLFLQSNAPLEN